MAGPKRIPYKNYKAMRTAYRREYLMWFLIGAGLTWPLAAMIGKRATHYQGGVAVVPYQRIIHDWPNMNPTRTTWKFFRRYAFFTCFIGGNILARKMSNDNILRNKWYTRPDLKPKAAMVKDTDIFYDDVAYKQLIDQNYKAYKHLREDEDSKKGAWYRFFRPMDANFEPKTNLYVGRS